MGRFQLTVGCLMNYLRLIQLGDTPRTLPDRCHPLLVLTRVLCRHIEISCIA